jgi:hypothetical protein
MLLGRSADHRPRIVTTFAAGNIATETHNGAVTYESLTYRKSTGRQSPLYQASSVPRVNGSRTAFMVDFEAVDDYP